MGMIGNSLAQGLISGANIVDGTVDTPDIKDSAVTTAKHADASVTTAKIVDANVTTAKIADANVTTAKVADANITPVKLSAGKPIWDSAGKVFINASTSSGSPVGQLQVWENTVSSANVCIDARSGQAGGLSVGAYTTTLLQGSGANSGGSGNVAIKMHHNDNIDLRGDLSFWTKDNQNTQYERLRITSGGTVGVGTNNPNTSYHLDVAGMIRSDRASNGGGQITFSKSGTTIGLICGSGNWLGNTNTDLAIAAETGKAIRFYANGSATEVANISGAHLTMNTGNIYARAAVAYSALTDLGWTAPIQIQETGTGTNSYRYMPIISGTSVSSSGYRQHTVFGSARGTTWGEAFIAVGGNDSYPTTGFYFSNNGNFSASGTKNFAIDHPVESLSETHQLLHAAVEAPRADLIYRGVVDLVGGTASVSIDAASNMADGTFALLCRNVQCFTTNETDWTPVRGSVVDGVLTIQAQDPSSNSRISWMVVGERKDSDAMRAYDDNGAFVTERLKSAAPVIDPNYELAPAPGAEVQE